MTSKDFNNQVKSICEKYKLSVDKTYQGTNTCYEIDTIFGKLSVIPSPSPRIKLYTVYMRFRNGLDLNKFREIEGGVLPSKNGKWNLHMRDPQELFDTLDERLVNMDWLRNNHTELT